jgi:hypothetical protein
MPKSCGAGEQCPTFLLQTFVEWASQTINKSFWAGAYYR